MNGATRTAWLRPRGLFGKYVVAFVGLVVFVLAVNGALETWFTYNDTIELLAKAQSDKADAVARRIQQYIDEIERQISFATRASATTLEQRRADYQLLLLEVPAIERLIQLDSSGREQLRAVRNAEAVTGSGIDYSGNPGSRRRAASRSGCRRFISTGSIPSCPSQCRTPVAMPARRLPRSVSSS
ncbi:MAG TPA: hypothetical protein VGH39_09495 [Xanthobacteraceae bacterium]